MKEEAWYNIGSEVARQLGKTWERFPLRRPPIKYTFNSPRARQRDPWWLLAEQMWAVEQGLSEYPCDFAWAKKWRLNK